jgi:hypothetical protein
VIPVESKELNSKIFNKRLNNRFKKMFRVLDGDGDGYINSKKVNLEDLNVKIVNVLSEMLFEIEDFDLTLSEVQFCKACENLYNSVKYHDKIVLLNEDLERESENFSENFDPNTGGKGIQRTQHDQEFSDMMRSATRDIMRTDKSRNLNGNKFESKNYMLKELKQRGVVVRDYDSNEPNEEG